MRIVTGFVEQHIFAGYSGGGKGVLPGVAAAPNIMRNHNAENLLNPAATFCSGPGNPIFEEMREVAVASDVTFLCNVTLTAEKAVSGFFCGGLVPAHDAAMAAVDRSALRAVPQAYDIVVGTNGGYPADLNVYQSIKGMAAAARGVREGGAIVIASECREGVGNEDYAEFLSSRENPEALMALLLEPGFHRVDQMGDSVPGDGAAQGGGAPVLVAGRGGGAGGALDPVRGGGDDGGGAGASDGGGVRGAGDGAGVAVGVPGDSAGAGELAFRKTGASRTWAGRGRGRR